MVEFRTNEKGNAYPLSTGQSPTAKLLSDTKTQPVVRHWSGSQYYDNGYGFYFDYDVEITDSDEPAPLGTREIRLDGMTEDEVDAKWEELRKSVPRRVWNALIRTLSEESTDRDEKTLDAYYETVNDAMYLDAIRSSFDYWDSFTSDDLDQVLGGKEPEMSEEGPGELDDEGM